MCETDFGRNFQYARNAGGVKFAFRAGHQGETTMKFSIIYEAQMVDTSRKNEAQVFQDMVDEAVLAEEMGFDCIWSVEHHCLSQYAHLSAPESFLAFIAGRTTRIHVGHGVVCLPFKMNHPIKVAERIATLDLLSRGRLHFGVGKGGTVQETGAFDTPMELVTPQVDESMYMIPKMWMQEVFEHHSDLIDIPARPIHPKPFQDPHPLMYMACTREEALEIAGSRGLGALVLGFSGPDEIAKKNAIYRKAYANRKPEDQVGFRPHQHLAALCPAVIMNDKDKAKRVGTRGQRFFAESIRYWYAGGDKPSVDDLDADAQIAVLNQAKDQIVAYLGQEKIPVTDAATSNYHVEEDAYGTVDQAIRYVERLEAAGADEILFLVQMGTIPHEVTMETIRNIGKYLIPHFREKLAIAAE
jgi:alkanesulfonate monooxygenase SsuD/methylene tetrahydromethanopterin reductase-like flavin-dependent oxidoreductase (luciferase family)